MQVRKVLVAGLFFVGILSGFWASGAEAREPILGHVVSVVDGDTIKILTLQQQQITIRFAEIDAPEKDQPWGQKSKETLSDMVFNKNVKVLPQDIDRYGRTVGRVYLGDVDINLFMVSSGAAWAYRKYLTDPAISDAEQTARTERVGLWALQADQIVPPWDWRAEKNKNHH